MTELFIPSPSQGVWEVLGFPVRAYAICIIIGIVLAWVMGSRRWAGRGGRAETLETAVLVAVPLGIVGARIYHVITDAQLYFGPGRDPVRALYIWEGGLGIYGAVAAGALGIWLVARRRGASFMAIADALAPGLVLAQAVGRIGNYFNQELFGRPTTLPWGLEIDAVNRPDGYEQFATFHPTFLYELLWNVGVCLLLIWAGRRFSLGRGKTFALYVVLYALGRFWIEALRIDPANVFGGVRLNNWTTLAILLAGLVWFVWLLRFRPGLETSVEPGAPAPEEEGDERVAARALEPQAAAGSPSTPATDGAEDGSGAADEADPQSPPREADHDGATGRD
ncbi:prolipoprotein diacylglyceryl transferase [Auraticoccus monumenti]|uniref:Phosphatidylglycerol--prolipoprotein diacylglyceryl transferase n=1 Tax=Auraticoccus monumenti TaxID=675864 RepID=A0A1G7B542_9ACTN|nr:prolipoprotein diacylglyceryl transferase [Auraticoccus monumenti]SDE22072.1 prolipoprotein diacylglyceryl transferase [Auraticoccus monumenti]